MVAYNAVVIYLPSMAVRSLLGISQYYSILLFGSLCILYSVAGGLKAVLWTDTLQGALMLGSVLVVASVGTYNVGGLSQVLRRLNDGGRLNFDGFLNTDLTTRHTLIGMVIGTTIKEIYMNAINQVQVQRALSLPSLKRGQLAFVLCSLFGAIITIISAYLGAVVYSAYGSCDPYLNDEIPRRDVILLHYVAHHLEHVPGLRGLFVAGIFSACLSTLSSAANSIAALVLNDFVRPLAKFRWSAIRGGASDPPPTGLSDKSSLPIAKLLTALAGAVCVLAAFAIDKANARLMQATATLSGAIGVPFLSSFVLGMYTNFANTTGVLAGFLITLTFGGYFTYLQVFVRPPLEPTTFVQFNQQCRFVFNMTREPTEALYATSYFVADDDYRLMSQLEPSGAAQPDEQPPPPPPLELANISYLMLPLIQCTLMVVVTCVVSLATGGLRQTVDERLMVGCLGSSQRSSKRFNLSIAASKHNQSVFSPHNSLARDHKAPTQLSSAQLALQILANSIGGPDPATGSGRTKRTTLANSIGCHLLLLLLLFMLPVLLGLNSNLGSGAPASVA